MSKAQAIARMVVEKAMNGSLLAVKILQERTEGKVQIIFDHRDEMREQMERMDIDELVRESEKLLKRIKIGQSYQGGSNGKKIVNGAGIV